MKEYTTKNIGLASCLKAKGNKYLGADKDKGFPYSFAFEETDKLAQDLEDWDSYDIPRRVADTYRELKAEMKD